ncbi:helix-turn-helix domain-containing protein [Rhizobium sp. TH2]|uniref:helix-turn-helix domain-containing protein n=1 Tax=Rhizobium sp. TH2 TaxID=2775403 RepID=UPI002156F93C|nr:helix-turn-helix domain-containing protein [Rhizobium sp. TH2]UVC07264.1 helix-turn-helix domain-containing protein [Rhizobium sp. TH2]
MRTSTAARVPTYSLYGEAQQSAPDFWIHSETIASRSRLHNWEIKQHRHESFFQILQIRNGEGDALLGAEKFRLSAGTLVFVPPGFIHGFRFSRDLDGQVITMLAERVASRPDASGHAFAQPRVVHLAQNNDSKFLNATLDRIEGELASGFSPRSALLDAYLDIVLTIAATLADPGAAPQQMAARDRISRLNALIGSHYREHRPAAFYADKLGVSVTHLNRIARAGTGRSMNALLTERLISEAQRNLVFSLLSIQQIAYDLGFSDSAYFIRVFTRVTGETPGAFRERERGKPPSFKT